MLYSLLKFPARLLLWIYIRKLRINKPAVLKMDGPLLIAANHPNSFLDAIILAVIFKRPICSLTRGDAFKNKTVARILRSLHMLPVYRTSEGVENIDQNFATFSACREIFKKNGIVLIFSEGRCVNEWHLRPLKKGTARLALSSWAEGIPLKILPLGLNYHSFREFGKNVDLNFADLFTEKDINISDGHGRSINSFNEKLSKDLASLVYEIDPSDLAKRQRLFDGQQHLLSRILLASPAFIGFISGLPLYYFVHLAAWKNHRNNDHFDSTIVSFLFFSYPLYVLLIALLLCLVVGGWAWLVIILMPFCAWSYTQFKKPF